MKTFTKITFLLKNAPLFILFLFEVELIFGQCQDNEAPNLELNYNLEIAMRGSSIELDVKDFVVAVSDDCSREQDIQLSFRPDSLQKKQLFSFNQNPTIYPVIIFAKDLSGKITARTSLLKLKACSNSLVCNDQTYIAIVEGFPLTLTEDLFLEGEYCKNGQFSFYYSVNGNNFTQITQFDENLPKVFTLKVIDNFTQNSCWGIVYLTVIDCSSLSKLLVAPGSNRKATCFANIEPEKIGFPIKNTNTVTKVSPKHYHLNDGGNLYPLRYSDRLVSKSCSDPQPVNQIERTWILAEQSCGVSIKEYIDLEDSFNETEIRSVLLRDKTINTNKLFSNIDSSDFKLTAKDIEPIQNQCWNIGYAYSDWVTINDTSSCAGKYYKITRTWSILNWCTNQIFNHVQTIYLFGTDKDLVGPTMVCEAELTAVIAPNQSLIQIWAADIAPNSSDNCGVIRFSFDPAGKEPYRVFTRQDAGKTFNVVIYGTDLAGNQNQCWSTIKIVGNFANHTKNLISGRFLHALNSKLLNNPLPNLSFKVTDLQNTEISNSICASVGSSFVLCVDSSAVLSQFKLEPSADLSFYGNVTAFDMVQIFKYLFNVISFNNYQKIAADVDCSSSINILDILQIRRHILGIRNMDCDRAEFYSADVNNPIEIKSMNFFPDTSIDIVPLRKGDVSFGAFNFKSDDENDFRGSPIEIVCENKLVQKGEVIDIWLSVRQSAEFYGIQLSGNSPAENFTVLDISSPLLSLSINNDFVISQNDWRVLMINSDVSPIPVINNFLKITIKANRTARVNEIFNLDNAPLEVLFITDDYKLAHATLEYRFPTKSDDIKSIDQIQLYPNPSSSRFVVEVPQSLQENFEIKISDMSGKIIYQNNFKHRNIVEIYPSNIPNDGIYFLNFSSANAKQTVKLIKLNE